MASSVDSVGLLDWLRIASNLAEISEPKEVSRRAYVKPTPEPTIIQSHSSTQASKWIRFEVPSNSYLLLMPYEGDLIFRAGSESYYLPPGKVVASFGPSAFHVLIGRGNSRFFYTIARSDRLLLTSPHPIDGSSPEVFLSDIESINVQLPMNWTEELWGNPKPLTLDSIITTLSVFAVAGPQVSSAESFTPSIPDSSSAVHDLCKQIWANPWDDWSLENASTIMGYSPFYLSRMFRQQAGSGIRDFVRTCRLRIAVKDQLLSQSGDNPDDSPTDECLPRSLSSSAWSHSNFSRADLRSFMSVVSSFEWV